MDSKENSSTAMAILLLAKMVAKAGKVKLTKSDRFAFAQIAASAGWNLPAFIDLLSRQEND